MAARSDGCQRWVGRWGRAGDTVRWPAALGALGLLVAGLLAGLLAGSLLPAYAAAGVGRSSCGSGSADGGPSNGQDSGSARISLDRTAGGAGTLEHVQGTGWPPGANVALSVEYAIAGGAYFDANGPLDTEFAGADGSFTSQGFRLPLDDCRLPPAPGTQARLVALAQNPTDPRGAGIVAYASFAIVAAPTIVVKPAPSQVIAGATALPVVGEGWGAGTTVTVALGHWVNNGTVAATLVGALPEDVPVIVSAGSDGSFTTQIAIPSDIRWGTVMQVVAAANTPTYGDLALLDPSFAQPLLPPQVPTIALDRPTGNPGDQITVMGAHWWPSDKVTIAACKSAPCSPGNPQITLVGAAVVNDSGTFKTQVRVPPSIGGFPAVVIVAYTPDYDPTTSPFFLRSTDFILRAGEHLTPSPSVATPPLALRFDLGAVLGLIMAVVVLAILAEPAGRSWKARARARTDA